MTFKQFERWLGGALNSNAELYVEIRHPKGIRRFKLVKAQVISSGAASVDDTLATRRGESRLRIEFAFDRVELMRGLFRRPGKMSDKPVQ